MINLRYAALGLCLAVSWFVGVVILADLSFRPRLFVMLIGLAVQPDPWPGVGIGVAIEQLADDGLADVLEGAHGQATRANEVAKPRRAGPWSIASK
jgi:hypothetical protein